MRMDVVRDKNGQAIGTFEADEIQTPEGLVAVEPELEEGQELETIEVRRSETFDLDGFYKRLGRRRR